MSNLYDDFENRFTNAWFSTGWVEVDTEPKEVLVQSRNYLRKDLSTLQEELNGIQEHIENISQAQLRLANLAAFYFNRDKYL